MMASNVCLSISNYPQHAAKALTSSLCQSGVTSRGRNDLSRVSLTHSLLFPLSSLPFLPCLSLSAHSPYSAVYPNYSAGQFLPGGQGEGAILHIIADAWVIQANIQNNGH